MLQGHYESAVETVRETITKIGNNKVVDVKPEAKGCQETYPCEGHGGAVITLGDGSSLHVPCSSVSIGALEVFYLPRRYDKQYTGSRHFIDYIDSDFFHLLQTLAV